MGKKPSVKDKRVNIFRSICEVNREIYEGILDSDLDNKSANELIDLVEEAYVMGKKMDRKLRQYKHNWDDDWWKKNKNFEVALERRKGIKRKKRIKKCIYFPLMGDYDTIKEPTVVTPGWDYICFTNNPKVVSKHWEIMFVDSNGGLDDAKLARKFWILNHRFVGNYDISISIGAQIQPTCDLDKFTKKFLPKDKKIDMSLAKHPVRNCIYKEANKCMGAKKDDPKIITKQMDFYRKDGFPKNQGLSASGIIIRKHNRPHVEKHCEEWWKIVKRWSLRDQLAFHYILWKYNLVKMHHFDYDIIRGKGGYFKKYPHKKGVK